MEAKAGAANRYMLGAAFPLSPLPSPLSPFPFPLLSSFLSLSLSLFFPQLIKIKIFFFPSSCHGLTLSYSFVTKTNKTFIVFVYV